MDVELPLAGPGGRSYAFIIDWHIRLLLALAWAVAAFLVLRASGGTETPGMILGLPAALIYLLYHPVVELAMSGQTPGKRFAGVRVVARNGQPPTIAAVLIRNVFRLVDAFPAFYTVGLVTTMLTRDSVRVGDLAAGTVLVYLPAHNRKAALRQRRLAQQSRLPLDLAELASDLLDRWPQLAPPIRRELAITLLTRGAAPPADPSRVSDEDLRSMLHSLLEPPA
ncbi:MAG: RDD family protein [Gammaproteobacteria bacterium]